MADLIRNALVELVELQDMKVAMAKLAAEADYLESPPKLAAYDCMATGYASRRSGAWEAARAALAAPAALQEPTDYKAMFQQAVASLAAISEALAIPDDEATTGEPEVIIDYIRELKRERDEWVDAGYAVAAEAQGLAGQDDKAQEAAEIIENLITNIESHGMYSQESTLGFLTQAFYCLRPANAAPVVPKCGPSNEEAAIRAAITLLDGDRDHQNAAAMRAMLSRYGAAPRGYALVPLVPTQAINEVLDHEGWTWADLLAAAEAITEEQYNAVADAPQVGEDAQPILWLTQETYGRLMDSRTGKTVPAHVGRTRTARIPLYITPQSAVETAPAVPVLTADHQGMRVDYAGLLRQVREALRRCNEPSLHEGVRQLAEHLKELGQRWYAGDAAVADEFLQLYCIEKDTRAALATQGTSHGL